MHVSVIVIVSFLRMLWMLMEWKCLLPYIKVINFHTDQSPLRQSVLNIRNAYCVCKYLEKEIKIHKYETMNELKFTNVLKLNGNYWMEFFLLHWNIFNSCWVLKLFREFLLHVGKKILFCWNLWNIKKNIFFLMTWHSKNTFWLRKEYSS